jgi:hypothetical protein
LRFPQVAGVRLDGDFRSDPTDRGLTRLLIAAMAVAAVGGVVVSLRRHEVALPVFTVSSPAVAAISALCSTKGSCISPRGCWRRP